MEKELLKLTLNELEDLKFKLKILQFKARTLEEEKKLLWAELETLKIKANTLKIKTMQSLIHKVRITEDINEILEMLERAIKFKAEENRQKLLKSRVIQKTDKMVKTNK